MSDKQQQWASIQSQAPALAIWLMAINKVFGKPTALRVELPSGEVIESGVFKSEHARLQLGQRLRVGYE